MAKKCLMNREKFEAEEHAAQEHIRNLYESRPHTDAESAAPAAFPEDSYLKAEEYDFQDIPAMELGIDQVMPHFDWRMFLAIWGFKYGHELPDDPEINKILAEGKTVLERFRTRHEVLIRLSFRSMLARRKGNDIDAKYGSCGNEVNVVFPMMRRTSCETFAGGFRAGEELRADGRFRCKRTNLSHRMLHMRLFRIDA